MRDEKEEIKKQARSNKQTRQSNTAHPRQSLFLEKMSCLGWDSNPRHSILQTCTCIVYASVCSVLTYGSGHWEGVAAVIGQCVSMPDDRA